MTLTAKIDTLVMLLSPSLFSYSILFLFSRAINNELLDTYQLKSLDAVLEASISKVAILKADDGKYTLAVAKELQDEIDLTDNFALREPYDKIIRCLGFSFDKSIFNQYV